MLWMVRNNLSRLCVRTGIHNAFRCACRGATFWACRPRLLWLYVNDMLALRRSRRQLADLAPHQRADIGVTAAQVEQECDTFVFGEISPWASLELRTAVKAAHRPSTPPPRHERSFYRARGRRDLPGEG